MIGTGKAMAGRKCKDRAACTGASPLAIGHALDGARGIFAGQSHLTQRLWIGIQTVVALNIWDGALQQHVLRCQPCIGILGSLTRHIERTVYQPPQYLGVHA